MYIYLHPQILDAKQQNEIATKSISSSYSLSRLITLTATTRAVKKLHTHVREQPLTPSPSVPMHPSPAVPLLNSATNNFYDTQSIKTINEKVYF